MLMLPVFLNSPQSRMQSEAEVYVGMKWLSGRSLGTEDGSTLVLLQCRARSTHVTGVRALPITLPTKL